MHARREGVGLIDAVVGNVDRNELWSPRLRIGHGGRSLGILNRRPACVEYPQRLGS